MLKGSTRLEVDKVNVVGLKLKILNILNHSRCRNSSNSPRQICIICWSSAVTAISSVGGWCKSLRDTPDKGVNLFKYSKLPLDAVGIVWWFVGSKVLVVLF